MLSLSQKESILRKKGVAIPPFPARRVPRMYLCHFDELQKFYPQHEREEDLALDDAVAGWQCGIELLYEIRIRRPVEAAIRTAKSAVGLTS